MARARERPSVIVNADSMQVYGDLQVLTARPSLEEQAGVPHRLFGHSDGAVAYSTGQYVRELATVLIEAEGSGLWPIIIGGTGLYFRAILEGLSPVPEIPSQIRVQFRDMQREAGTGEVYRLLTERDPVMASRLKPSDPQRIVRALEVVEATGRSLSWWQSVPGTPILHAEACERIVVSPDKETVQRRADERFDRMIETGAVDEVKRLLLRELSPELPVMRALGVPQLAAYLRGEVALDDAVTSSKLETRAYIKRQRTWIKRNMSAWNIHKTQ